MQKKKLREGRQYRHGSEPRAYWDYKWWGFGYVYVLFFWGRKASGRKTLAVEQQPSEPLKRRPFAALSSINRALATCIYARTLGSALCIIGAWA